MINILKYTLFDLDNFLIYLDKNKSKKVAANIVYNHNNFYYEINYDSYFLIIFSFLDKRKFSRLKYQMLLQNLCNFGYVETSFGEKNLGVVRVKKSGFK